MRLTPVVPWGSVFRNRPRHLGPRDSRARLHRFRNGEYRLYYTGYNDHTTDTHHTRWPSLGLAHSVDGITWTRDGDAPVFSDVWTEDVHVSRDADGYFVVAEGANDVAHALTSADGLTFTERGPLDIRRTDGRPIAQALRHTHTLEGRR
ncbi:MAG: hypothetical protein U0Q11_17575 [Vicinamibacterales bacterium]